MYLEKKIMRNITVNPYFAQIFKNLVKSSMFIDFYRYFDGFCNFRLFSFFWSSKRRTELKI